MPTDNEWLRLIYTQLSQSGTGGASINQAQVKAAIESAINIDQLEAPIDFINALMNIRDSWRSLTLTNATATYAATSTGFEWTVPAGKEWQFQSAYIPYATDATVLTRVLRAYAGVVAGFAASSASRVGQAASLTYFYNVGLYPSLDVVVDSQFVYLPLPPLVLGAGDKIGVTVPGKPAGDTFTNPIAMVMERSL